MKSIIAFIIFLLFSQIGASQGICEGNLGENIFEEGDFGSGTALVLNNNPNIAPGYFYTNNVPSDGAYTVCSNTGALNGLYPTWIVAGDNSNDPNGYMMVVNASFEPGIFYEEDVEGLCENTLYEFSADILNLIRIGTSDHLDPNVSFLIDGVEVYTTGTIPKTEQWRQYGFSFVTTAIQSSITLTLRNNAPGGIGNDLALDNISFRPCGPSNFIDIEGDTTIFLCIDDDPLTISADIIGADGQEFAIQWQNSTNGMDWTTLEDSISKTITHTNFTPGDYYYRYYSAGNEINILNEKCRIISDVIKLTILPDTYNVTDTICEGLMYEFGNQSLLESGSFVENFESQLGCDSTVFLDLVRITPKAFNIGEIDVLDPSCYGFEDGNIVINNISGGNGGVSYTLFDGVDTISGATLSSGIYTLYVEDRFGCFETQMIELIDPPEISVEIGSDTMLRLGDELLLNPTYSTNFETIQWTGQGAFTCTDCEAPVYVPFFTGDVAVIVKDENECEASDSFNIIVDDENFIILPNIFSPNDDRINDFFTINFYGRSVSEVNTFSVFDRWGNIIYSASNLDVGTGDAIWDGYSKGQEVQPGVYSYVLEALLINDVKIRVIGEVTLLK